MTRQEFLSKLTAEKIAYLFGLQHTEMECCIFYIFDLFYFFGCWVLINCLEISTAPPIAQLFKSAKIDIFDNVTNPSTLVTPQSSFVLPIETTLWLLLYMPPIVFVLWLIQSFSSGVSMINRRSLN